MKDLIQKEEREDIAVLSVGIAAAVGNSASAHAVHVMEKEDIDISGHRARQLEKAFLEAADLILTMTHFHKQIIVQQFPEYAQKVQTLSEASGLDGEIDDPFGGSEEVYRQAAAEIKKRILLVWKKIQEEQGNDR